MQKQNLLVFHKGIQGNLEGECSSSTVPYILQMHCILLSKPKYSKAINPYTLMNCLFILPSS